MRSLRGSWATRGVVVVMIVMRHAFRHLAQYYSIGDPGIET